MRASRVHVAAMRQICLFRLVRDRARGWQDLPDGMVAEFEDSRQDPGSLGAGVSRQSASARLGCRALTLDSQGTFSASAEASASSYVAQ
jgi:hypothetical protein